MALSAFDDKAKKPGKNDLKTVLRRTSAHWESLKAHLAAEFAPLDETWMFSGAKWGWSLRLKQKKRAVLYLTPLEGHFLAGLALGEKAVKAAHESRLPASVLAIIDAAPKYPEGRGIRLEIKSKKAVEVAKKLAAIKMAN